jgi:hypothetical protein
LQGWPTAGRGPAYREALQACHDALAGTIVRSRRQASIAAAKAVGVLVREAPLRG